MLKSLFLNNKFILLLILLNALIVFLSGFALSGFVKHVLSISDHIITFLFVVELIVKVREYGFAKYIRSNWNRLDLILILISVPAVVTSLFTIQIADVSFLLVFRILRVFKAFRFFKFIPNIGSLIEGVQRALKSSIFILLGFLIYTFILGTLSFYLFQQSSAEYFGDPLTSLYSIFRIFTIDGWTEMIASLLEGSTPIQSFGIHLYFIFIVLTGGIFGLSLVNSIFVDSMISDNNDELIDKVDSIDKKITELLIKVKENETRKDIGEC